MRLKCERIAQPIKVLPIHRLVIEKYELSCSFVGGAKYRPKLRARHPNFKLPPTSNRNAWTKPKKNEPPPPVRPSTSTKAPGVKVTKASIPSESHAMIHAKVSVPFPCALFRVYCQYTLGSVAPYSYLQSIKCESAMRPVSGASICQVGLRVFPLISSTH